MDNFDVVKELVPEGLEELTPEELGVEELGTVKKTTNIENYVKQVQLFKRTTCGAVL
jgi:hypothetical protein